MKIKVIGVGSGALKLINKLIDAGVENNFYVVDCEQQELAKSNAKHVVTVGKNTTHGLRTSGDILMGKRAARESEKELRELVSGADVIVLLTFLGGGMGCVASEIARFSKEQNPQTPVITILGLPLEIEGHIKKHTAQITNKELGSDADVKIEFWQDKLIDKDNTNVLENLSKCDNFLVDNIKDILSKLSAQENIKIEDLGKIFRNDPANKCVPVYVKEEMKKRYARMAMTAFSLAEDQGIPPEKMFYSTKPTSPKEDLETPKNLSIATKKEAENQQRIRDTANYKSALELAKREGVPEKDIAEITDQTNLSDGAKFHALLKLVKRNRK